MRCDLRTLFTCPPRSEEELFRKVKRCVSVFEPERLKDLKPAPEEDIQALEQLLMERYGCSIPASYKLYLREMGQEDGGILSQRMDHQLEEWKGFRHGNMAKSAKDCLAQESLYRWVEKKSSGCPPFWMFFYAALSEMGYGFLLDGTSSDELVQTDGGYFGYCHDTFSKLLFFLTYSSLIIWMLKHGKPLKYSAGTFSSGLSCIHAMHNFFARNAAFHVSSGLTLYIKYHSWYRPKIRVVLLSEDLPLTKQITDTVLQRAKLEEGSLEFTRSDWEQIPKWLTFNPW